MPDDDRLDLIIELLKFYAESGQKDLEAHARAIQELRVLITERVTSEELQILNKRIDSIMRKWTSKEEKDEPVFFALHKASDHRVSLDGKGWSAVVLAVLMGIAAIVTAFIK